MNRDEIYALESDPSDHYRVVKYLGKGVISTVYLLQSVQDGKFYAVKIPNPSPKKENIKRMEDERTVLTLFLEYFAKKGDAPPMVPNFAVIKRLAKVGEPNTAPQEAFDTLFQEFIPETIPQMYDVYRQHLLLAETNAQKVKLEQLLWQAAEAYLEVLEVSVNVVGYYTTDRKDDTFRWDLSQNPFRLIVMDWNAVKQVEISSRFTIETNLIRNMSQIWFSTFTALQASLQIPGIWADEEWQGVSYWTRILLQSMLQMHLGQINLISSNQELIRRFTGLKLDNRQMLLERLEQGKSSWDAFIGQQKSAPVPEQDFKTQALQEFRFLIADIDLLKRLFEENTEEFEQAQRLFTQMRDYFCRDGEKLDSRRPVESLLEDLNRWIHEGGKATGQFFRINQEALQFLVNSSQITRLQTRTPLFEIIEILRSSEADFARISQQSHLLEERLDRLKEGLLASTGADTEQILPLIYRQSNLLLEMVRLQDLLRLGEIERSKEQLEMIQQQAGSPAYETVLRQFGLSLAELERLKAALQVNPREKLWGTEFTNTMKLATETENSRPLEEFHEKASSVYLARGQSLGLVMSIQSFIKLSESMLAAYEEYSSFDELLLAFMNLYSLVTLNPQYIDWAMSTPLYKKIMTTYKTRHDEFDVAQKEKRLVGKQLVLNNLRLAKLLVAFHTYFKKDLA